jgi:hypothetical protein
VEPSTDEKTTEPQYVLEDEIMIEATGFRLQNNLRYLRLFSEVETGPLLDAPELDKLRSMDDFPAERYSPE